MKKLISILLSMSILMMQFGCTTSKVISMDAAKLKEVKKNSLVLITPIARYQLLDYKFTDKGIEGKLGEYSGKINNIFNVYTDINFYYDQYQKTNKLIKVPNENIKKIKYSKTDGIMTFALVGGLLAIFVIGFTNNIHFNIGLR